MGQENFMHFFSPDYFERTKQKTAAQRISAKTTAFATTIGESPAMPW